MAPAGTVRAHIVPEGIIPAPAAVKIRVAAGVPESCIPSAFWIGKDTCHVMVPAAPTRRLSFDSVHWAFEVAEFSSPSSHLFTGPNDTHAPEAPCLTSTLVKYQPSLDVAFSSTVVITPMP